MASSRQTRIHADHLARLLGSWSNGPGALRGQLARALREVIELGEVAPLTLLPPERTLAGALAVSRSTIVAAYDELRQAGIFESRQGRGTWVSAQVPEVTTRSVQESQRQNGNSLQTFLVSHTEPVDFSTAATPALAMVADVAASIGKDDYLEVMRSHGYMPRGLPSLVESIAQYYRAQGLDTSPDQILVTSGAQQAIDLIAANHISPGCPVVVEEPAFRGALPSFRAYGAWLTGVERDNEGVSSDDLRAAVQARQPRLTYLQPVVHNPTGGRMSRIRHAQVAALAREAKLLLIDDRSTADTAFDDSEDRLFAHDLPEGQVITIGSLSKIFWSGLRIGWIRASREKIHGYAQLKSRMDLGSCIFGQLTSVRLMQRFEEARQQRRELLSASLEHLVKLLEDYLPEWDWLPPCGGSSLWIRIPRGDSKSFSQVAMRHGVSVEPGATFTLTSRFHDRLRMPFKDSPTVMNIGVARLAKAWEDYTYIIRRGGGTDFDQPVVLGVIADPGRFAVTTW